MKVALLALFTTSLSACAGSQESGNNNDDASVTDRDAAPDSTTPTDSSNASDPASTGPTTFTMMNATIPGALQGRTLPSTVFLPQSAGPHALAVISPGFKLDREQYTSYSQHLASWGFVVILTDYFETGFSIDHQKAANDVPAVITWALAQTTLAVDPQRIATLGHSLGGKISILAASGDPRIKAVVAWDPVDSSAPSVAPEKMATMTAAIAVIGETTNGSGGEFGMPCAPAAENFTQFYATAPSPALQATVANADHMDWVDDPSCFYCTFCTDGSASADVARTATKRLDVAWLRKQLFADATMDAWLTSATGVTVVTR